MRIFITGTGILSPVGIGTLQHKHAIQQGTIGIRPLRLFSAPVSLPVGEIPDHPSLHLAKDDAIPRTHRLALAAAREAMAGQSSPPDAVILGGTTGGILTTESALKEGETDPAVFSYHSTGSVAEFVAGKLGCTGIVMTISTACSSGTAALKLALELIRTGLARSVLAGGADSLCRLTFHGFNSLQLIDPDGAHPFDQNRRGMSVGEGAAMLLLKASERVPENAVAEVLGGGLSCDAYHPTAPHPEGQGAFRAMNAALKDAGLSQADIDYVNLHGTGTPDNDRSEGRALYDLFGEQTPPSSSIKGATGHSLAASGAIEAVISAISITDGLMPGNSGCRTPDPEIPIRPVTETCRKPVRTVLSNSFGFGGNNAAIILGTPDGEQRRKASERGIKPLSIAGSACLTGAGNLEETLAQLSGGGRCDGVLSLNDVSRGLVPRNVRRLKRLSRMALSLAVASHENAGLSEAPASVFWGTGWGPLSETHDFLTGLFASDEQFPSPTDFVGSVHNAPAGHIALHFKAEGPNMTTTGGDYSFEQTLFTAGLLAGETGGPFLVTGADEFHPAFSPLFDASVRAVPDSPADGGGALCMVPDASGAAAKILPAFYEQATPSAISRLVQQLGGPASVRKRFGAVLAGIPAAFRETGSAQLQEFLSRSGYSGPVVNYRTFIGEFASASAVAAVLAVRFVQDGLISVPVAGVMDVPLDGRGILLLGFGAYLTAVEVTL